MIKMVKVKVKLSQQDKKLLETYRSIYEPAQSKTIRVGQKVFWRTGKFRGQEAGKVIEVRAGGRGLLLTSQGVGRKPTMRTIGARHLSYAIVGKGGLHFGASKDITTKKPKKKRRR